MGFDFSSFHFANAGWLALAALIPVLALAYLKRLSERTRVVSSVILLQLLPRHQIRKRRFKPPLRFFLEALSLLLLALAAASPILKQDGERVAVVLDNSMSVGAKNESGGTRFDAALVALDEWLEDRSGADAFTLYVSTPQLKRVDERSLSNAELKDAVKKVALTLTPDSLQAPLEELGGSGNFDRILLLSDKKLTYAALASSGEADATKVEALHAGNFSANTYFTAVRLEQVAANGTEEKLSAAIATSGNALVEVTVQVSAVTGAKIGKEAVTDFTAKKVNLNPGKPVEIEFLLSRAGAVNYDYFKLSLTTSGEDSIAEDNSVFLTRGAAATTSILLVSPDAEPLGLDAQSGFNAKQIRVTDFATLSEESLKSYSLIIFHKSAPELVPRVSSLLILPPAENKLFPVAGKVQNPRISSWAESHPLTAYLRMPLLEPGTAQVFQLPLWAQAIVNSEAGPLVVAGQSQGVKFAAVGFELLPFEGLKTPTLSVLTLNLVNWLLGEEELRGGLLTGGSLRLAAGSEWTLINPKGQSQKLAGRSNEPIFAEFPSAGIYRLSNSSIKGLTLYAVNAIHPEESSTFVESTIELPAEFPRMVKSSAIENPFWPWLVIFVLVVLLAELLLRLVPRTAAKESKA